MTTEVIDIMARESIHRIQEEQYAQSELIKTARELAQSAAELAKSNSEIQNNKYADLERRMSACDTKHEAANQHRRRSDKEMSIIAATLQESLTVSRENQTTFRENQETLKALLGVVQEHSSTVKRARDNHTFWDKLKEFLAYAAILAAGLFAIKEIFKFFS